MYVVNKTFLFFYFLHPLLFFIPIHQLFSFLYYYFFQYSQSKTKNLSFFCLFFHYIFIKEEEKDERDISKLCVCVCVCLFVVLFGGGKQYFYNKICVLLNGGKVRQSFTLFFYFYYFFCCAKDSLWVRKLNDRGMRDEGEALNCLHTQQTQHFLFYCDSSLWEASTQKWIMLKICVLRSHLLSCLFVVA